MAVELQKSKSIVYPIHLCLWHLQLTRYILIHKMSEWVSKGIADTWGLLENFYIQGQQHRYPVGRMQRGEEGKPRGC